MAIEILPGEIADEHWPGQRCGICGRAIGGDGSEWGTCEDAGKPHLDMKTLPAKLVVRYAQTRLWDNAQRMLGFVEAVKWIVAPRPERPALAVLEAEDAPAALDLLQAQYVEWPMLANEREALRSRRR